MLNMYVSAAILGLAGAAAASAVPLDGQMYPKTEVHQAFRLVVNVTGSSPSFDAASIQNTYITSLHDGGDIQRDLVGQDKHKEKGLIFYLNGTETDHYNNQVLTESLGDFTSGLGFDVVVDPKETVRTARLVHGGGDASFSLIHYGEHSPFLRPETWVACKEKLVHYTSLHKEYIVFKQVAAAPDYWNGPYRLHVPGNCVTVTLLPECVDSPRYSKNSAPTHKHVIDAHCYPDAGGINWRKSTD